MKEALIRFLDACAKDGEFRMGLIIAPAVVITIFMLLLFAKGCFEYDTCTDACGKYNNEANQVTIECLKHCDER